MNSSLPPTSAPSRSLSPCCRRNAPAVMLSCTCQPQPPTSAHRKISHAHIATATPAEHIPSEAHREPPKWQRGPRANQKKPAHGKKSKNPSPGLSPRVLHEPTYSADERHARQFSEGSPRCIHIAEAVVAVIAHTRPSPESIHTYARACGVSSIRWYGAKHGQGMCGVCVRARG